MKFSNIPKLQSNRVTLRLINKNDVALTFQLRSNPEVCKYIARPLFTKLEEAEAQVKKVQQLMADNQSIVWVIGIENEKTAIGTICLWNFTKDRKIAEVGYDSLPKFQGKGYLTEALKMVLNFGFKNLNLHAIEAYTSKHNSNSIKLLEKQNFKLQKHEKDLENPDNNIYRLQATTWLQTVN